jgi:hypothetical protein
MGYLFRVAHQDMVLRLRLLFCWRLPRSGILLRYVLYPGFSISPAASVVSVPPVVFVLAKGLLRRGFLGSRLASPALPVVKEASLSVKGSAVDTVDMQVCFIVMFTPSYGAASFVSKS